MAQIIKVYGYSRCATCRKALAWLDAAHLDYEVIDITVNPPAHDLLERALNQLARRQLLFNTSGKSYRALGPEVVKSMTDKEALDALSSDGRLIKRPFVELDSGKVLVGFKPEDWSSCLLD